MLTAAALDPHWGSGDERYFVSRQQLWEERFIVCSGCCRFCDAEIASIIAPRNLIMEHSAVDGPPKPREGRGGAAPGKLKTPDYDSVELEFERARGLLRAGDPKQFDHFKIITGTEGVMIGPGSDRALVALLNALGVKIEVVAQPAKSPSDAREAFDPDSRQQRQIRELEEHTQKVFRWSESARVDSFWNKVKAKSPEEWVPIPGSLEGC
jgi:hypothetical protein